MTEELFDVVDTHDVVIDTRSRSEVHRLGLRHRATHVLVSNARGQFFLQKRSLAKDCEPGLWDSSASGHVHSGECYGACALRELEEELGLRAAAPLDPLFKLAASPLTGNEFAWVYHCEARGPLVLDPVEIAEGRWLEPAEIDLWLRRRPGKLSAALRVIWPRIDVAGLLKRARS